MVPADSGDAPDAERAIRRARSEPARATEGEVDSVVAALGDADRRRRDAAVALAAVAEAAPGAVRPRLEDLASHLRDTDVQVRGMTASAFADVAAASPSAVAPFVPELRTCLDVDYDVTRTNALRALVAVAREEPTATLPALSDLRSVAADESATADSASRALFVLQRLAEEAPARAASAIPECLSLIERTPADGRSPGERSLARELDEVVEASARDVALHRASSRKTAALVIATVGEARPGDLVPYVGDVAALLADDDLLVRKAAADALRYVAAAHPAEMDAAVSALVAAIAGDADDGFRGYLAHILGLVAAESVERVAEALETTVPTLVALLESDDPDARAGAAGLLAFLAEAAPDAVEPAVPALVERLDDDSAPVRGQAMWALGYVGGEAATSALRRRSRHDPDPELRALAAETVDDLDGP